MHQEEGRPLDSRERILDAALEEFGVWGYEGASTNRVCRQAEISKGLLFHYYKTKQQLFAEVMERCICDLETTDGLRGPFDETCQRQLFFFVAHPFHHRIITDLLHEAAAVDSKLAALRERVILLKRERFARFLKGRVLRPDTDLEMALELLLTATDHLQDKYLKYISQRKDQKVELAASFRRENRQVLSMLLNGIAAAPVCSGNGGTEC